MPMFSFSRYCSVLSGHIFLSVSLSEYNLSNKICLYPGTSNKRIHTGGHESSATTATPAAQTTPFKARHAR